MLFTNSGEKLKALCRRFARDESGNVIIYVTICIVVFMGFVGLAIDFGRAFTTSSEAQSAADAAALSAASQLNGHSQSIVRATNAAQTTPLVSNLQTYADGVNASGVVTITNIRFLTGIPASDLDPITASFETTDPLEARFVEVTTEALTHNNIFMVAVGADATMPIAAVAVAGYEAVICNITPMMMCNPNESDTNIGATFDVDEYIGTMVLAKNHKGGGFWAPGNWGLLDHPGFPTGAKGVAQMLASATPPEACYSTDVDTETGAKVSVNDAFNVRFDMYDGFFKKDQGNSTYRPATNVTKGKNWTASESDVCDAIVHDAPGTMGLPRDVALEPTAPEYDAAARFGDGRWDCAAYWAANHSTTTPTGCVGPYDILGTGVDRLTRHDIYQMEMPSAIPDPTTGTSTEEGEPMCYSGAAAPSSEPDRRIISVAVVNCIEQEISGKSTDVATVAYIEMFMTEPATEPSDLEGSDVYFEFVGSAGTANAAGGINYIVQLHR
jgi:Flp pilus assembly protein TadG